MYATVKEMFFPFLIKEAKEVTRKSAPAKAAVQDERTTLIDKMVATWGTDRNVRRRYFEVSGTV